MGEGASQRSAGYGHEARGSRPRGADLPGLVHVVAHAEVGQFDVTLEVRPGRERHLAVEQDVPWLDVPVDHVELLVQKPQGQQNLPCEGENTAYRFSDTAEDLFRNAPAKPLLEGFERP